MKFFSCLCILLVLLVQTIYFTDGLTASETTVVDHQDAPDQDSEGFWARKTSWKARWVKYWQTKKIYVPLWKKVWTPVVQNEWVPMPNVPEGWENFRNANNKITEYQD